MATDRRRRRLQRLTLLFVVFVLLAGGVAGLWVFQQQRQQNRLMALRTEGMAAVAAGDDRLAAKQLGDYVDSARTADPEALLAAAEAAYRLPLPGNDHIKRAQQWLLRLREEEPGNARANDLLLEIADTQQGAEEAVRTASDVLRSNPENGRARLLRASRRLALDEPTEAMEDIDYHLERHPGDSEAAMLRVQARLTLEEPAEEVAAAALQAVDDATDPATVPGLQLAAAYAQLRAGDAGRALDLLKAAAESPPVDGPYAIRLARMLDAVNAFPEANAYLIEHRGEVPVGDGPGLEVTRRLFEAGRLAEVVERLEPIDPRSGCELLAIRAMSLAELGRTEETEATLAILDAHADPAGPRWSEPLRRFYSEPRIASSVLEAAAVSVDSGLRHPYLLAIMGRSLAEAGDDAGALARHREAAEGRPAWAAPRVLAARALLELDRPADAEAEATEAFLRRRDLLEPLLLKAEAMARRPGREAETLTLVQKLREQAPDQPRLVVLEAASLAATGRQDAARVAIETAVDRDPPLPPTDLLELARVGQSAGLDTETLVLDRLNEAYGDRPELVFARATRLAREGDVPAGLRLIQEKMKADEPSWRLVEAAYLQLARDPAATAAWEAVSDDFEDRLDVQRRVLESPATTADRDLADKVIRRVRALAGEDNLQWRLARARWLLERPAGEEDQPGAAAADAERAEGLLDAVVSRNGEDAEALLLRARAHERQGSLLQAVRDAESAMQRSEENPATRLEVARLQQAVGNFPAALSNLLAVERTPAGTLTAEQSRAAALLLASQGEYGRAVGMLERLDARGGEAMGERERLLLAQLYAQTGREADADRVVAELLRGQPDPGTVTWAAGFYAESGRTADADATLARLGEAGVEPARRRAILAEHAARYGSLAEALAGYEAAAAAGDPGAAGRLAAFNLAQGRGRAAVEAAAAGRGPETDAPGLAVLVSRAAEVERLASDPAYRPILGRLVAEPEAAVREVISRTLRLAADPGPDATEKLGRLRTLAAEQPGLVELQTLAAQLHLRADRNQEALDLAEAAAIGHPNDVPSAQARALAFFALERWDDALASAIDWRRRSARDPLAADLLIARSHLAKGEPREAEAALSPYRGFADRLPEQMADFGAVYSQALAGTGRADEAVALLGPHLGLAGWRAAGMALSPALTDPARRSAWLERLTAAVPNDSPEERFRLANAWWGLHLAGGSDRRDAPDAGRLALRVVSELAERPDAQPAVHAAAGVMAERLGMREEAAAAYRRALEIQPAQPALRNNLAMVLLGNADAPPLDAPEGLRLAREAVAADPDEPNYRDTLSLAFAKNGDLEEALQTIEVAIELDPGNSTWRERQAELMKLQ